MRVILPGQPQAKLQALTTGLWSKQRFIIYISGNALVVLSGPNDLLQSTYHDSETDLEAVAFNESSGKIAVCSKARLYVYSPYGKDEGTLKWSQQFETDLVTKSNDITTLSWGSEDELLVGNSKLALYSALNGEIFWSKDLAAPVRTAEFSPEADLIASFGVCDRFVKIWRRLSSGTSGYRFDYGYLAHPATVTDIQWRRPHSEEHHGDHPILYTFCADKKLRVWTSGDPHILRLWTKIDLADSIQPRTQLSPDLPQHRYAFVISAHDFTTAVKSCSASGRRDIAIDHVSEAAHRTPEVCVVLDDRGHMSAWGLETMDCKTRQNRDPFNIALVEGMHLGLSESGDHTDGRVQFHSFAANDGSGKIVVLAHHFNGTIEWLEGLVDEIFDPSSRDRRLRRHNIWTGHTTAIRKLRRTTTGKALISRTETNESAVWLQNASPGETTIRRQCVFDEREAILRTAVLRDGDFTVFLHKENITLWDTRQNSARLMCRSQYHIQGEPLCLIVIPGTSQDSNVFHLASISSQLKGLAWEVRLSDNNKKSQTTLSEFDQFALASDGELAFVLSVDPAGSDPVISGFLDTFARDIAISLTKCGKISTWTAKVDDKESKVRWLLTSTFETSIKNPYLVAGTSVRKAAVVDVSKAHLTIWNTTSAQLEYEHTFNDSSSIQDLDWSSTPDNQSVLAVGFPHKVVVYSQLRYDYLNRGPSWTPVREINVRDLTPYPIGDSVWLDNGSLVIGAGNQLFVQDPDIDVSQSLLPDVRLLPRKDVHLDIFSLASHLNGPLPLYHPQFLTQCILAGNLAVAQRILVNFYKALKFFTDGDELDSFLGMTVEEIFYDYEDPMTSTRRDLSSSYQDFHDDEDTLIITEEVAESLHDLLTKVQVPHLSSQEQFRLADVIECVGTVERHRRSVDENAARFLVFFRHHVLQASQMGTSSPPMISWREVIWAYHSSSQDILVDLVSKHFKSKMQWQHARECGMFMWLTDAAAVKAQFEVIARNEYTKSEDKNPIDCSLYYLALKKKAVLSGLWRMAGWHREQQMTQRLLANDFTDQRWKVAAQKNAYALMGKRRFEYAAAFFLLADRLKDAVSVISNQLNDLQLAIAVARVYEGDSGPILHEFLEEHVLPPAIQDGNRWLTTWAFWMLNRRDKAVRALVTPLRELLSPQASPSPPQCLQSKFFLTDDPALVFLYRQLREKSLQTLRGAIMISSRTETDFVLHTARLYGRMGCDILALDLVRSWEFLADPAQRTTSLSLASPTAMEAPNGQQQHRPRGAARRQSSSYFGNSANASNPLKTPTSGDFDPRKLLRRRGSLVVADLPLREAPRSSGPMSPDGESIREEGETNGAGEDKAGGDEGEEMQESKNMGTKLTLKPKPKPPPTQFQEPDANSLLDSFGF